MTGKIRFVWNYNEYREDKKGVSVNDACFNKSIKDKSYPVFESSITEKNVSLTGTCSFGYGSKKDYLIQQIAQATEAVRKGVPIAPAANKFCVPTIILYYIAAKFLKSVLSVHPLF